MTVAPVGVAGGRCALVSDGAYPEVLIDLVDGAVRRCLVSMFIVDFSQAWRSALLDVADALAAAAWRGVDTRVVVGGSRENYRIAEVAASARAVLGARGVPVRWLSAQPARGSHGKVVVVDDQCLLGSHNWSPGSFSGQQRQDSVLVDSAALAGLAQMAFEPQWLRAAEEA